MGIFGLGPGVGMVRRPSGVIVPGFTPEQLFALDTTFASSTGWFAAPGSSITGGQVVVSGTANTVVRAVFAEGDFTRTPAAGEHVYVQFALKAYTEGNINPRIRYTDGTFAYFFGDRVGNGPLAGGDAQVGTHRSLTLQIAAGKTLEYIEFRTSVRNGSVNLTFDDFQLWTSETALNTRSFTA